MTRAAGETGATGRAFRLPAILRGIGLGGSFDGVVLHQILQCGGYVRFCCAGNQLTFGPSDY